MNIENNQKIKILAVDDEPGILFSIEGICSDYKVISFEHPRDALSYLKDEAFDIIIVDYKMPALNGLDFLIEANKIRENCYTILLTAFAEKDILQKSINQNLINKVIEKPINSNDLLTGISEAIIKISESKSKLNEIEFLKESYRELKNERLLYADEIIGINGGLKDVYTKLESVAKHPVNILITGETGTGKELMAQAVHNLSPQFENNFIKINCAAIPDNLMESELFGHVKGAFTDAVKDKPGKIELANNGTLFLDEIGELKLELQAKLLRVLQEKELFRVGSNTVTKVDFRLIAATNKDLSEEISTGNFREDLYYRICTFPIEMPPLRNRLSDLPELIIYFVETICTELNIKTPMIQDNVFTSLKKYHWPGNIRELENAIKRVVIII